MKANFGRESAGSCSANGRSAALFANVDANRVGPFFGHYEFLARVGCGALRYRGVLLRRRVGAAGPGRPAGVLASCYVEKFREQPGSGDLEVHGTPMKLEEISLEPRWSK